ncbi:AAA family ATPase [Streptomyces sp. WELS2]|uniref:AAA family ATPase n=1 Tax=Streptomyces sp. WELS2 TaxID=2749435 RepID=UPI0015F07025|nr:AAA family ATPase [Streptomyces sp. WELS2]
MRAATIIVVVSSRFAVVGAYGSGKTILTEALEHLTGLPRTQGSPMREPIGGEGVSIHNWTEGQVLQLTVNRYAERIAGEAALPEGFFSDGSVLHEWIYAKLRLVAGSYPGTDHPLDSRYRDPVTRAYEQVADEIGLLAKRHVARGAYQAFLHLPIEFELAENNRPINETFRKLSDELLLPALEESGVPVHTVAGSLEQRLEQVLEITGVEPLITVAEAVKKTQNA